MDDDPADPVTRRERLAAWWRPTEPEFLGLTVLLVGAFAASALWWWQGTRLPDVVPVPLAEVPPAGDAGADVDTNGVLVFVSGAVRRPGIVHLTGAPRVADAVAAAGGLVHGADPAALNLARRITDGEQIHVPVEGEEPAPPSGPGGVVDGVVDLNRASAEDLATLPGIGPVRSAAIVDHRDRHGPFAEPGDLRDVPGIGEATFQRLAPHVRVG